jgi:hypothetical protein
MKLINRAIYLTLLLFVLFNSVEGQKKNESFKVSNVKVSDDKPSIYISFERFGKRTPLREGESEDGIWLRIHNNIRYPIRFCSFGISEEGEQLIASNKESQIGINYDIEITSYKMFGKTRVDAPSGYPTGDLCFGFQLNAGKSVAFSVPAEHLVKGLSIKTPFKYDWENETEINPTHFVYFNSLDLPKK